MYVCTYVFIGILLLQHPLHLPEAQPLVWLHSLCLVCVRFYVRYVFRCSFSAFQLLISNHFSSKLDDVISIFSCIGMFYNCCFSSRFKRCVIALRCLLLLLLLPLLLLFNIELRLRQRRQHCNFISLHCINFEVSSAMLHPKRLLLVFGLGCGFGTISTKPFKDFAKRFRCAWYEYER